MLYCANNIRYIISKQSKKIKKIKAHRRSTRSVDTLLENGNYLVTNTTAKSKWTQASEIYKPTNHQNPKNMYVPMHIYNTNQVSITLVDNLT